MITLAPDERAVFIRRITSRVFRPRTPSAYFTPRVHHGVWFDVLECGHEIEAAPEPFRSYGERLCLDCGKERLYD